MIGMLNLNSDDERINNNLIDMFIKSTAWFYSELNRVRQCVLVAIATYLKTKNVQGILQ